MKKPHKNHSVLAIVILCFLFFLEFGFCLNLSSTMGEVILENLTIGATYSVVQQSGMYLEVLNRGDVPVSLRIDVTKPKNIPEDLKEGYEPIPSTDWVKIEKSSFSEIQPSEKAITDITIIIHHMIKSIMEKDTRYTYGLVQYLKKVQS